MSLSVKSTWQQNGTAYSPKSLASNTETLPGGVYRFVNTDQGWYLERTQDNFEFAFKVYNGCDALISRIEKFWKSNGGNLGIMLGGLRGSGKTMAAQLLANSLIKSKNIPVLVVRNFIPLNEIFTNVKQDLLVIYDEFEKTHDKEEQQALLSVVDGMSRSTYNRLIVFTTNTPAIDENFKDRPSRIHYHFEFKKVADEIIEGLINDSLPEDLHHFKNEIFEFLHSRSICTIDIVKAVIAEVKTFKESPRQFEEMLNISKGEPLSFTVKILNPDTNAELKTICHSFKTDAHYPNQLSLLNGNTRSINKFIETKRTETILSRSWDGNYIVNLLEKCAEENCWLAELAVPKAKTQFDEFKNLYDDYDSLYLDIRPADWEFNFTSESVSKNKTQFRKLSLLWDKAQSSKTVHGTGKRAVFKVLIEPDHSITTSKYVPSGYVED